MKTFRRPDVGHIQFKWVLDDPKTYARPIGNDRVFVLTPNVELMEYSCMEGNLQSLLSGAITPWLEAKESDENLVYGEARDWGAYDRTKPQKLSGVIKTARYNRDNYGSMTIDSGGRTLTVILAPPVRMDFRGLTEDMLKPGVSVAVKAFRAAKRATRCRPRPSRSTNARSTCAEISSGAQSTRPRSAPRGCSGAGRGHRSLPRTRFARRHPMRAIAIAGR